MPFNGSGVFQRVRNWVADATAGIKIRADYHDAEDDGFADGLTNCITKDGQTIVTQNIPWNSKRITGLADPINPQDAATKAYADTKLDKIGGTITGDLAVDGKLQAFGYRTRKGLAGPYGGNWFNFDWNNQLDAWVDDYYVGILATQAWVTAADTALQNTLQAQIDTKQANLGFTPVQQGGGSYQVGNKVYIGWDGGGLRAQVDGSDLGRFFMELNNQPGNVKNARLAFAGDVAVATGPQNTTYEPYSGSVHTGWIWIIFNGTPLVSNFRHRYMQLYTTSWFTIGYA
jgi:hypothetical protein